MSMSDARTGSVLPWRQMLPIDRVAPHPDNPRIDLGDLDALETSIRKRGLDHPITAVPRQENDGIPRWWVIDGERRLRAMQGWNTEIPAVVKPLLPGESLTRRHLLTALVTGTMQRPLGPIERARAYGRLIFEGPPGERMTQRQVAEQVGLTDATINQYLLLLDLAPALQDAVQKGEITVARAAGMVKQARAAERRRKGQKPAGPVWEPEWFTRNHELYGKASARCNKLGHSPRRRLGKRGRYTGACGKCWQKVAEDHASAAMLERCAADVAASDPALAGKWRQEAQTLRS